MVEALTVFLAIIAFLSLISSTVQVWTLTLFVREPGIGRIVFWSLATLKLWAAFILLDFIVAVFFPPVVVVHRDAIRIFLAVYLVLQAILVNAALLRWRFKKYAGGNTAGGESAEADVL